MLYLAKRTGAGSHPPAHTLSPPPSAASPPRPSHGRGCPHVYTLPLDALTAADAFNDAENLPGTTL
jgi:hypothetical protein